VEVTHAKQRQRSRKGASLDVRDRRVDLERLGDCNATLRADLVAKQAAERGGNKKRNDRNVVTVAVTKNANIKVEGRGNKNANIKVEVTHAKQRQRCRIGASLDVGDRLVDLERLGDRDATLRAEVVARQAANEGVTKKE
jgi:hypothetical protein